MQTSPAVEQIKTLNSPRVRGISPVGKEKVCSAVIATYFQCIAVVTLLLAYGIEQSLLCQYNRLGCLWVDLLNWGTC